MNVVILGSLILATLLGIFGQGISNFLNEFFLKIPAVYYLTFLTILSVFLYFSSFVLRYLQYKKLGIEEIGLWSSLSLIVCVGLLTSSWSIFVLGLWWG
jgi:hypothetical protein